jgi:hypothetical protein
MLTTYQSIIRGGHIFDHGERDPRAQHGRQIDVFIPLNRTWMLPAFVEAGAYVDSEKSPGQAADGSFAPCR